MFFHQRRDGADPWSCPVCAIDEAVEIAVAHIAGCNNQRWIGAEHRDDGDCIEPEADVLCERLVLAAGGRLLLRFDVLIDQRAFDHVLGFQFGLELAERERAIGLDGPGGGRRIVGHDHVAAEFQNGHRPAPASGVRP
jgi:hypothetical protein